MRTGCPPLTRGPVPATFDVLFRSAAPLIVALFLGFPGPPPLAAQESVSTRAGQPLVMGHLDGSTTNALFSDPAGIAIDAAGTIYIADNAGHVIRRISSGGMVVTLAGEPGVEGSADGIGAAARFSSPTGLALDEGGNLFVSDTGNHTLRRISPAGAVSTVAGSPGQSGAEDGSGAAARFNAPLGLVVAADGTLYLADCGNHLIRRISAAGVVTTWAGHEGSWGSADGPGSEARFNGPVDLVLDRRGHLFVSDSNNHTLREIDPAGHVATFAGVPGEDGTADGDLGVARFCKPAGLAFDHLDNLFVAGSFDHTLRRISPAGRVSTISGVSGEEGAEDGDNGAARFFNPYGAAVDPLGYLVITDTYNQTLRRVFTPFEVMVQPAEGGVEVSLRWDSVIGRRYQVQAKGALSESSWRNLGGPVTAVGLSASWTETPGSGREGEFYRVVMVD